MKEGKCMNFKEKTKRLMAGFLGVLMMLGLLPATAFAAYETGVATFDYCYQSDGTNICYWDSFTADGYSAGDTSGTTHRCSIYVNGDEAFCIEPGVRLMSGDTLKSEASERWNALSKDRQEGVKTVLD